MSQPGLKDRSARAQRAYRLGIANGVLFLMGMAFMDPATVLPSFVSRLTDSELAIGLVSAITLGGFYLPQLFIANHLQSRPYKRPLYILGALLRGLGLLTAIPLVYFLALPHPPLALAALFLCYAVSTTGGGLSAITFFDIVAKTIPGNRLGRFFGHRFFWGGLGAIGCGLLVRAILSAGRLPFPGNYCLLFALTLASFVPCWLAFVAIEEPPARPTEPQRFSVFLREAPALLRRHRDYRLLLISRLLIGGGSIALPFYVVYCRRVLEVPEAAVGTYLSLQMTGGVLLVPLWAYLHDHRGPRSLVVAVTGLCAAIPAVALLATVVPLSLALQRFAFGLVFFLMAAAGNGSMMGYTNYLLAIAPEESRPLYLGVHNTLFAVTTALPLFGGLLVNLTSFQVLFGVAAVLSALGAAVPFRLSPPRA
jgi:MFS family permease